MGTDHSVVKKYLLLSAHHISCVSNNNLYAEIEFLNFYLVKEYDCCVVQTVIRPFALMVSTLDGRV